MKYLVFIVIAFIVFLFFQGTRNTAVTQDKETVYRENFMQACLNAAPGEEMLCTCFYSYIVTKYTWDERVELDKQVQSGESPQAISEALLYCTSPYTE